MELVWLFHLIQILPWNSLKNIRINHGIGTKFLVIQISLWNIVEKYPNKPWNWNRLSSNPNITMEFIEKYPDKPWDWNELSRNPNITIEIFEKYPDKPWDWIDLSRNTTITMEIIEKYPNKPWNWNIISYNPTYYYGNH